MYARRRRRQGCAPLFIAILGLWVVGVVIAFLAYQNGRQAATKPTVPPTTAAALNPTATPETEVWIVADKAHLLTTIIPLYYDPNSNWNVTALGLYAGHLQGTPEIGKGGNYVLAGHVELKDGSPGPFADLDALQPGDPISIYGKIDNRSVMTQYVVTEVKAVAPDDISAIRNHGQEELTLITCKGWDESSSQYTSRLIVHARPILMNMGFAQ